MSKGEFVNSYKYFLGHLNDAAIFNASDLGCSLGQDMVDLPNSRDLPNSEIRLPYFFIGDSIFGLKKYLLTPYVRSPTMNFYERIYNYRLSRARRQIECAFGTLVAKWLILQQPLNFSLETTESIVMSLACLHNFIITCELKIPNRDRRYINEDIENEPEERDEEGNEDDDDEAINTRLLLTQYFVSPAGNVPWQWNLI